MEVTDVPAVLPAPTSAPGPQTPRRTRSLKANFLINVAGAVIPLGVSLVTVPIYIRHIGDARYGVLSIVWVLLGYFGFLDLGLSRAAANALARLRDAPQDARARVLVTTLVLNLGMGLIGSFGLALAGSYLLQHVLNVPEALKPEIASAFPWIVALFPLALVSGVGVGTLESREEFLRANILQVVGTSLGQVVPMMLAVAVGPSLAVVIPAAAIARGLTALTILVMVVIQEGPLSLRQFDRDEMSRLTSYGGWITVSAITSPLLTSFDQFVIGSVLGVAAVAHYAIFMNLVIRMQIIPNVLTRTVFPRLSHVGVAEATELARNSSLKVACGLSLVACPAMLLLTPFINFWLSLDFPENEIKTLDILLLGVWVNGLAFIPGAFIQARGQPSIPAKFHLLEVVPFVALLLLLSHWFGLQGVAAAWMLRATCDALLMFCAAHIVSWKLAVQMIALIGLVISAFVIRTILAPSLATAVFISSLYFFSVLMLSIRMNGLRILPLELCLKFI